MFKSLRQRRAEKAKDTPYNEQSDPYLERIINEMKLNSNEKPAIINQPKTQLKESK